MFCYGMLFIFPLNLNPNVGKLGITSIFGVFSIFFIILILIIQLPSYITHYWEVDYKKTNPMTHLNIFNVQSGFDSHLYFFKGFATFLYSYGCHYAVIPIYSVLRKPSYTRMNKIFGRTILMNGLIYLIVGISGFFSEPLNTPDLIISRRALGRTDYLMNVGKIFFILSISFKIPACYNSYRVSFNTMFFDNSEMTFKR